MEHQPVGRPCILLVEDEFILAADLQMFLGEHGYEVAGPYYSIPTLYGSCLHYAWRRGTRCNGGGQRISCSGAIVGSRNAILVHVGQH